MNVKDTLSDLHSYPNASGIQIAVDKNSVASPKPLSHTGLSKALSTRDITGIIYLIGSKLTKSQGHQSPPILDLKERSSSQKTSICYEKPKFQHLVNT